MLLLQKYKNKRIAIYGMGKTGLSAAKTFQKMKAKLYCWDDNKNVRKKIKKLSFNVNKFWKENNLIDVILLSPGIDINKCRIKNFLKKNINKVITDLDLFFEFNKKATMISITGTNGKSTTCKILEKVLKTAKYKVKTVGNIGSPILYSKEYKKKYFLILEVSSYQLQYSKLFRSKHAAILNISPDHLERHKTMNKYISAKLKLIKNQNKNSIAFINKYDKYTQTKIILQNTMKMAGLNILLLLKQCNQQNQRVFQSVILTMK